MPKSPNTAAKLAPVHPGAILKETSDDLGISMNRVARELRVPANRISAIVAGQRGISGETALRLTPGPPRCAPWSSLECVLEFPRG